MSAPADSIPLGFLDLAKRAKGPARRALQDSLRLAELADAAGYARYWVAEHHVEDAAHSCPEVLLPLIAARTERIRVGSGAVLLKYYSPLKVAETFLALEALFPGRIDLGVAKGPGVVDRSIAEALVSENVWELGEDGFAHKAFQLAELLAAAPEARPGAGVRARPWGVAPPPLWILGSGPGSPQLAARLGCPLAVALFFGGSSADGAELLAAYRASARPGTAPGPTIVAVSVTVGDSPAEARRRDDALVADGRLAANVVGTPAEVAARLRTIQQASGADELLITSFSPDHEERAHLLAALATAWRGAAERTPLAQPAAS
ncbi:MsnO8 family LLM class oxidoreductase [Kitasatospora sp. NPDC059673]|uniref:MsnO8 family LLM class oxidoreductase n=1 Tax=Kitasatospora sp. NPDC059673 TaxID=3346901 RepID=UPI0036C5ADF3